MNSGRNDCQRISRRVVLTGTALALGAAAAATVVPAEGRSALRRLHPLPTVEHVQSRSRWNQPERLVPAVCQEDV